MSTQNAINSASMAQPHRNVGSDFWLMWTLATAVAWAIGTIIYSIFQFAIVTILAPVLIGLLVLSLGTIVGGLFGGVIGTTFGFTQGLILKQYGYSVRRFTRASLVGGIIGGVVSAVIMCILVLVFAPSLSRPLNAVRILNGWFLARNSASNIMRRHWRCDHRLPTDACSAAIPNPKSKIGNAK